MPASASQPPSKPRSPPDRKGGLYRGSAEIAMNGKGRLKARGACVAGLCLPAKGLHAFDHRFAEGGAGDFVGAVHQAGEIVGDLFVADGFSMALMTRSAASFQPRWRSIISALRISEPRVQR